MGIVGKWLSEKLESHRRLFGRFAVVTLTISLIAYGVNLWQGADFLAGKREGFAHVVAQVGRVALSRWIYVPLFLLSGLALIGLHFHDVRERKRSRLVKDVMPGDRIITEEQTTPYGSISKGVMGYQNAAPRPKTVEVKAAIGGHPNLAATGEIDPEMQQPKCRPSHRVEGDQVVLVLENHDYLPITIVRCVVRGMHFGPFQTDITNPFPALGELQIGPPKLELRFPRDFDGAALRPGAEHWVAWYDTFDSAQTGPAWTWDHRLALYQFRTVL
jgi:hypothetical protein